MATIGQRILLARERRGWTQVELAKRAGLASPTISKIESGATPTPSASVISKIAGAFGVTVSELIEPSPELPPRRAGELDKVDRPGPATAERGRLRDPGVPARAAGRSDPLHGVDPPDHVAHARQVKKQSTCMRYPILARTLQMQQKCNLSVLVPGGCKGVPLG